MNKGQIENFILNGLKKGNSITLVTDGVSYIFSKENVGYSMLRKWSRTEKKYLYDDNLIKSKSIKKRMLGGFFRIYKENPKMIISGKSFDIYKIAMYENLILQGEDSYKDIHELLKIGPVNTKYATVESWRYANEDALDFLISKLEIKDKDLFYIALSAAADSLGLKYCENILIGPFINSYWKLALIKKLKLNSIEEYEKARKFYKHFLHQNEIRIN